MTDQTPDPLGPLHRSSIEKSKQGPEPDKDFPRPLGAADGPPQLMRISQRPEPKKKK